MEYAELRRDPAGFFLQSSCYLLATFLYVKAHFAEKCAFTYKKGAINMLPIIRNSLFHSSRVVWAKNTKKP